MAKLVKHDLEVYSFIRTLQGRLTMEKIVFSFEISYLKVESVALGSCKCNILGLFKNKLGNSLVGTY